MHFLFHYIQLIVQWPLISIVLPQLLPVLWFPMVLHDSINWRGLHSSQYEFRPRFWNWLKRTFRSRPIQNSNFPRLNRGPWTAPCRKSCLLPRGARNQLTNKMKEKTHKTRMWDVFNTIDLMKMNLSNCCGFCMLIRALQFVHLLHIEILEIHNKVGFYHRNIKEMEM